jgi:hypothetical protein
MNRGGTVGAVAIPVLSGTATFTDATRIMKKTVSGRVFDAGAADLKALARIQVRIVGQPRARANTDESGAFELNNVSLISNFPLYVETDAEDGATHRYRVVPGAERGLSLFRMGETQVRDVLEQLEGGISADSGLIVGAMPETAKTKSVNGLYPSVATLSPGQTLKPESYTVSAIGQLHINATLSDKDSRFVAVQVPEGPAIARLENKSQATIWSEMVFAQPKIINVLGPY